MPTAGDQFGGQPIEQFLMRGVSAHRAEIVRRGHDALAEVILPQAIDDHPRRQRMIGPRQPIGQRRTTAGGIRPGFRQQ